MTTCPVCGRPHFGWYCFCTRVIKTPEENRKLFREWREKNAQKDRDRCADYRNRRALAALREAKPAASPVAKRLLERANKATEGIKYGYTGGINVERI